MLRKSLKLCLSAQMLLSIQAAGAHPLFLIKPVPPSKQVQGHVDCQIDKNTGEPKHATRLVKDAAVHNDETIFCLPKDVAQLDMTVVIYANSALMKDDPDRRYMEKYESDQEKKDANDQSGSQGDKSKETDWEHDPAVTARTAQVDKERALRMASLGKAQQKSQQQKLKTTTGSKPTAQPGGTDAKSAPAKAEKPAAATADNTTTHPAPVLRSAIQVIDTPSRPASKEPPGSPLPSLVITADGQIPAGNKYSQLDCAFVAAIPDTVSIQIKPVPDERLMFKVELGNLHGLVTDINKAAIFKDSSGVLGGIDTEFADRTADIIADIGVTAADGAAFAAKVSPMLAMAQPPEPPPAWLKVVSALKVTKIVDLEPDQGWSNETSIDMSDVIDAVTSALKRLGYSGSCKLAVPKLTLTYDQTLIVKRSCDLIYDSGFEGIVFREPKKTRLRLIASNNFLSPNTLADQREMIAQTGTFSTRKIQKHAFSKVDVTVKLSDFGGVLTLDGTGDSPIKEVTGALRQIGDSLNGIPAPSKNKGK